MRRSCSLSFDSGKTWMAQSWPVCLLLLAALTGPTSAQQTAKGPHVLGAVPAGYFLHEYDDCGVPERQPHVRMEDSYCWTFATSDTDADLKSRSAVFSYKRLQAVYDKLDPERAYVLALTYASDHVYKRVQSLWANGVQLHEPLALPQAQAVRVFVRVPQEVSRQGKLALEIRIHGEVNATASVIELWADAQPKHGTLRLADVSGLIGDLSGRVLDLAYEPAANVEVQLVRADQTPPAATAKTGPDGWFRVPRAAFQPAVTADGLRIVARRAADSGTLVVPPNQLTFQPVRYRPLAAQVAGVREPQQSLNGDWRIWPAPPADVRSQPLTAAGWKNFRVPGQWLQQGFEIPPSQPVALAREFRVPPEWTGCRVFLRFDAIHGGTRYWINGRELGSSENLFTPVEWEVTSSVRPGELSRLDLELKVETVSERLSHSSGYAFHNLGGIDRSVRLYALPPLHIRDLQLATPLDQAYRDADLKLRLSLDGVLPATPATLAISLTAPDGQPVTHSLPRVALETAAAGQPIEITTHVSNPLKWNAEQPRLYTLTLELQSSGKLVERVERRVGFRQLEVRGSQLLVNGVSVKLAGACHHEIDPLTGRADTGRHAAEDVKVLKAANLNYLRTSHYPPTLELVEAADALGMYLEVEAPFCWVGEANDTAELREVLVPTSAMVDFYNSHPSVTLWSLANESSFNRCFEISNRLVRDLDPTRPTTFNNPDPRRVCDIANIHYPAMPWADQGREDPRPLLFGEYFFPVCHEQTDVRINPGLREFFGFGHSDPASAWGRQCAESFTKPFLKPCAPPGAWTEIWRSNRVLGGAIWAAVDESYYFADGRHAGYSWHHGFWGLLDAWRRPKPEWWLTKQVFAPAWFPARQVPYQAGQESVSVPVENRYAFTDLGELSFTWELGQRRGAIKTAAAPGARGQLTIPLPPGTAEGQRLILRATDARGELLTAAAIQLGREPPRPLPAPQAGPPAVREDAQRAVISGTGFTLVFDRTVGDFLAGDPRHQAAVRHFPALHVTQYDFGDLAGAHGKPYAVWPDSKRRTVERVEVKTRPEGLELLVQERSDAFAGTLSWLLDKTGVGRVRYDFGYSGPDLDTREAGLRFTLKPACDQVTWRRWSEWGLFPDDSISRTEGTARAFRAGWRMADPEGIRPSWPWSQDQLESGTSDFRSVKFNIYEAKLRAADKSGLAVHAQADRHVRPSVAEDSVQLHVLTRCPLGQVTLKRGDRLNGECIVQLLPPE